MSKQEIKDVIKETLSIIVIAFLLAMVLRTFIVEGRIIPTGSMLPTVQLNDRVMVNKFIYRFTEPQRGDVIVFAPPEVINSTDDYLKRVIGLPGETVEMKDGNVYVDDQILKEPYLAEGVNYDFGPVTVPSDSLLVLGDNRNSSFDSHMWNAWLTKDHLKGKAFMIYWPLHHITLLDREVSFIENPDHQ